ncbi:MAG: ComF family protein, partial [Candidatus Latescibacteria bacterium]|nr:ComF family protein [Candidatus Latescibacterota bacterium]
FLVPNNQELNGCVFGLVDDVFTTGATLDSCSRVLLESGVSEVYALTIARA